MVLREILISVLLLAFILPGYSVAGKKVDLTPSDIPTFESTGKTISIMPVTLRPQPKPGFMMVEPPRMDNEKFRRAIVEVLQKSSLFSEVRVEGGSDYVLKTDIIGERVIGGGSNIGLLLVRYSLIESQGNIVVWEDNLFSHVELNVNDVFMGTDRTRRLLGDMGKDNLVLLVNNIGNILSTADQN